MNLNIKNAEAHVLASKLSEQTGESMTQAVVNALRERLQRLNQPDALEKELLMLGRDCAHRLKEPYRSIAHGDLLYDERGLPK